MSKKLPARHQSRLEIPEKGQITPSNENQQQRSWLQRNRIKVYLAVQVALIGGAVASIYQAKKTLKEEHEQALSEPPEKPYLCFDRERQAKYERLHTLKYVPVTIHRVLPTGRAFGGVYDKFVKEGLQGLNQNFKDLNLRFTIDAVKDVQNDKLFDPFASEGADGPNELKDRLDEIAKKNAVPDTINLFILPNLDYGVEGEALGMLFDNRGEKGGNQIFLRFESDLDAGDLFTHEMGHIFGLLHTFQMTPQDGGYPQCDLSGDFVCDTPFDPMKYNEKYNTSGCKLDGCNLIECGRDDKTKAFFEKNPPLVNNFMSYYHGCEEEFTEGQKAVMNCVVQGFKPELLRDEPSSVELGAVVEVGCDEADLATIQEGIDAVIEKGGGVVDVCAGVYPEVLRFDGIKSTRWISDRYDVDIVVQAHTSADGSAEKVVIDGQNKNIFIQEPTKRDYSNLPKKEWRADIRSLVLKNIIFQRGLADEPCDEESMDIDQGEVLFDLTWFDSVTFDGVHVNDSRSIDFCNYFMPSPKTFTITRSVFDNNRTVLPLLSARNSLHISNTTIQNNHLGSTLFFADSSNVLVLNNVHMSKNVGEPNKKGVYPTILHLSSILGTDEVEPTGKVELQDVRYNENTISGVQILEWNFEKDKAKPVREVRIENPNNVTCSVSTFACQ